MQTMLQGERLAQLLWQAHSLLSTQHALPHQQQQHAVPHQQQQLRWLLVRQMEGF
jgi:hypothetical protein